MCDIWLERADRRLSVSDIASWAPQWADAAVARVGVCAEPPLHPDLVDVCAAIRDHGIRVDLLTNGMLLSAGRPR
jgi:wyosine [tRNA(Phe)-imidazoG37] synthetase (radical SAM superfamily)